jgi:glutamyl-tRNA reductase
MELVVIGLNHHTASLAVREKCALTQQGCISLTYQVIASPVIASAVILTTCNRLEIYANVSNSSSAYAFITHILQTEFNVPADSLYHHEGKDAVHHLLQVACGLDSMILGEAQILGQVSDAYQLAQTVHALTPNLHRLFMTASQTGKRAHSETHISRYATSVSHVALNLITHGRSVLIIGAGEMAEQAAHASLDHAIAQIHIINRTYESAQKLAKRVHGIAHQWRDLWDILAQVDCVICATSAPYPILQISDLKQVMTHRQTPLTMVDIAVPRNIEPSARDIPNVMLYDIDDIQQVVDTNLRQRQACVPDIHRIIAEEASIFMAWQRERDVVPTITDLRQKVQAIAQTEVDDIMRRLSHLDPADLKLVERLAHRLVNKILHEPTITLRQRAQTGDGDDYSRVVRDLFALMTTNEGSIS